MNWDGAPGGPPSGNGLNPNDRKLKNAHWKPPTTPVFRGLSIYKSSNMAPRRVQRV